MSSDQVEISSSSLKFSYLRFLADGASGLFVVLLMLIAYYLEWPIPGYKPLREIVSGGIGYEAKLFTMILLVILAVPLGLMINGFGWFVFGWVQTHAAGHWLRCRRLTASTRRLWGQDVLVETFGLTASNLYGKAQFYEELIFLFDPSQVVSLYHVEGLKRLLRSAAVVCLLCSAYFLRVGWFGWVGIGLLVMGVFLLGLSLLELYHDLGILFHAYLIALQDCSVAISPEEEQRILVCLLNEKQRVRERQLMGLRNA